MPLQFENFWRFNLRIDRVQCGKTYKPCIFSKTRQESIRVEQRRIKTNGEIKGIQQEWSIPVMNKK